MDLFEDIFGILKAPFVGDLDLLHLFLLVGAVLVFAAVWIFILREMKLTDFAD